MRRCAAAIAALFLLWGPATADKPEQILNLTEKVADWQIQHLETAYHPAAANDQASPRGWVYGALFDGMTALADVSSAPRFTEAVIAHGEREHWALELRPFHADDYAIGRSWVWAYAETGRHEAIAALQARFDAIMTAAPKGPAKEALKEY